MNNTPNATKRPSGLRACADGLDVNPDKDFAQKCMRYAADRMEQLERELTFVTEQRDAVTLRLGNTQERMFNAERQRDRLAEALERIIEYQGRFAEEEPESIATEALQSLTQSPNNA
jgi:hypothetical protein